MKVKAFLATVLVASAAIGMSSTAHANAPVNTNTKPADVTVVVTPGDTLSAIGAAHQTTYVRLFDANDQIQDPDIIHPGDNIRIPAPDEQLPDRPIPSNAVAETPIAAPAVAAPAAPAPVVRQLATPVYASGDTSVWDRLAACESGGNWGISTGNGFYGGLQFTPSSWAAVGGSGLPSQASREEQIARAQMLQARQGWGAWPACSAKLGLR